MGCDGVASGVTRVVARGGIEPPTIVVLRDGGAYDLMIRGSAREEANHDAVVGMLTALQQSILEVH